MGREYTHASATIVYNAQSITGAFSTAGTIIRMEGSAAVSFQLVWTSTVVGTWKIEVSDTYQVDPALTETWTDVTATTGIAAFWSGTGAGVVNGTAGNAYWEWADCGAKAVRITFTRTSSTGTVTCVAFSKARV